MKISKIYIYFLQGGGGRLGDQVGGSGWGIRVDANTEEEFL